MVAENSIPFLPLSCLPKRTNLPFLDDPELTVNSLSASLLYRREDPSAITMQMYRDQPADLVHQSGCVTCLDCGWSTCAVV
jgi:hypothetical protein